MATSFGVTIPLQPSVAIPVPKVLAIARFGRGTAELLESGKWRIPRESSYPELDRRLVFLLNSDDIAEDYSVGYGGRSHWLQYRAKAQAEKYGVGIEVMELPPINQPEPGDPLVIY